MGGLLQLVLGAAFDVLLNSFVAASMEVFGFRSRLKRLISTLGFARLALQDVEAGAINRTALEEVLSKGEQLIHKCSGVKWNVFKILYYAGKLSDLEKSVVKMFAMNVAAASHVECSHECNKILETLSNLEDKMDEMITKTSQIFIGGEPLNLQVGEGV